MDFIHVHYGWFNFPVFNVADSAITVGAAGWIGLMVVDMIRASGRAKPIGMTSPHFSPAA